LRSLLKNLEIMAERSLWPLPSQSSLATATRPHLLGPVELEGLRLLVGVAQLGLFIGRLGRLIGLLDLSDGQTIYRLGLVPVVLRGFLGFELLLAGNAHAGVEVDILVGRGPHAKRAEQV